MGMATIIDELILEDMLDLRADNGAVVFEDCQVRLTLATYYDTGDGAAWFDIDDIEVAAQSGPNIWTQCDWLDGPIERAVELNRAMVERRIAEEALENGRRQAPRSPYSPKDFL
jgi:hypothetical protein